MLSEYHAKKAYRDKRAREKLKEKELKEKLDAEAAKLQAEQDKMQKDMDKFFDASGAVVSTNIYLIDLCDVLKNDTNFTFKVSLYNPFHLKYYRVDSLHPLAQARDEVRLHWEM